MGLLLVFEQIVDAALSAKRAEAEGQFSLFDGGQEEAVEVEADAAVPDVEFDRKEKLAAEREMLGLYVSDHPLLGLERAPGRGRDGRDPAAAASAAARP